MLASVGQLGTVLWTMYEVDDKDTVVSLKDILQSSGGAPIPHVVADEGHLVVAFYLQDTPPDWDGKTVRVVGPDSEGEPVAIVTFERPTASLFGPPNDEAFRGHPLAVRGLKPYGAFQIENSSWVRKVERMNSVHPYHRPEAYDKLRHFILSFHDSTFECLAQGYSVSPYRGSVRRAALSALEAMD